MEIFQFLFHLKEPTFLKWQETFFLSFSPETQIPENAIKSENAKSFGRKAITQLSQLSVWDQSCLRLCLCFRSKHSGQLSTVWLHELMYSCVSKAVNHEPAYNWGPGSNLMEKLNCFIFLSCKNLVF